MPGAASGQTQVSFIEKEKPDIMVVGELREWETAEYIRDARLLGSKNGTDRFRSFSKRGARHGIPCRMAATETQWNKSEQCSFQNSLYMGIGR